MKPFQRKETYGVEDLVEIIRILRDPENGCPWDKVQTHQSIRKNLLEEAYEAAEALDVGDPEMMREEFGDLLMQVVFHCQMEQEAGHFDFQGACDRVCKKLIFRHPHIFPDPSGHTTHKDWETLKREEKGRSTLEDELDSVPVTLPALMKAQKTLSRAARYGVELQPLSLELGQDPARQVGELLLKATALAQQAGVDAEEALTRAVQNFVLEAKSRNSEQKANNAECAEDIH